MAGVETGALAWWYSRAAEVQGRSCPKCKSRTYGRYVLSMEGRGKAVEEFCLSCGWNDPIITKEGSGRLIWHRQREAPRLRPPHTDPRYRRKG